MSSTEGLEKLGWDHWFEQLMATKGSQAGLVARVVAVDRELVVLLNDQGAFRAKLSGSFMHRYRRPEELPCVGDWVCVEKSQGDDLGLIQAVLDRRTSLRRKAAGGTNSIQMIAANVDQVIIVQSCHFDFNLSRLERYLVMVTDGGAEPCILLTKTDLVAADTLADYCSRILALGVTAPILTLSNITGDGMAELKKALVPGKTYCFVGSSGVGKSTIINQLTGRNLLETGAVSATGEGRHTTVRRELLVLENGAMVIDNPGMREFGIVGAEEGLGGGFSDITSLACRCRYKDCTHTSEPGCAVLGALSAGEMDQVHYGNYVKLKEEAEFYQLSHAEKRKKDRDFGKLVKSVKKSLKRG